MTILRDLSDRSLTEILDALRREARDTTEPSQVLHDLQVHQIELELQNRELRCAQQALEESRDRYADLYDFAPVGYATLNRQGQVTQMNLTAAQLLRVERGRVPDLFLGARLTPGGGHRLLTALARVLDTGEEASIDVGLGPGSAPGPQRDLRLLIHREHKRPGATDAPACRVVLLDITQHLWLTAQIHERERQLQHLAQHDPLTGLPNRVLFADRLNQAIHQAHRERRQVALLFLDLDDFKGINDSLGHASGDCILQQATARITGLVREGDTVARLGGDEFTFILGGLEQDGAAAGIVAHKLNEALRQPFALDGQLLYVTASIGISLYPQDGSDVDTLVRNADSAMYLAKSQGHDTFRFYAQDMTARILARVSMESALHQALAHQEFALYYQPQHDLATGRILGLEALIRWHHPTLGLVAPDQFIPLAESTGLIVPIGAWVVRTAAAQMQAWRAQGLLAGVAVAINLSSRDLSNPHLAEDLAAIVREYELEPGALAVEITETWIMTDPEAAAGNIRRLHDLGIAVAIDDFGTGASSLAVLKRLRVGALKIDRSFVAELPADADDCAITAAILALGQALGLTVIAEGIETAAQADWLQAAGCRIGQGYLYSPALPADAFVAYCRAADGAKEQWRPAPDGEKIGAERPDSFTSTA